MIVVLAAAMALMTASDASPAVSSSPAAASTAQTTGAPKPADDPDKVICQTEEVTGSRFKHRVCLPRSRWEQMSKETEEYERQVREHTAMGGASSNPLGGN